jgi:hypothetical protein
MFEAIKDRWGVNQAEVEALVSLRQEPRLWAALRNRIQSRQDRFLSDLRSTDDLKLAVPRSQGGYRALELLMIDIEQIVNEANEELKANKEQPA